METLCSEMRNGDETDSNEQFVFCIPIPRLQLEIFFPLAMKIFSREEVTLSDTNEKAVIRGLDQYGFLEVRSRQSGQIMAVHPDGNTFDMMKGLITAKYR